MKRRLVPLFYVCGALLTLMCVTGLMARALVDGPSRDSVASAFSRRLGVAVSVGEARFDLASFLLLRPAISLGDVAIGNLLTARRISARIALLPLAGRRIEIRSILVETPRIRIESAGRSGTNLDSLLKKLSSPPPLAGGSRPAGGPKAPLALDIDEVRIAAGEALIAGASPGAPPLRIGELNLRVHNLSAGTNCPLELSARFFGEGNSRLRLEGRAGPFGPQVLPIRGKLTLTAVPRGLFGVLFAAPDKAKAVLEASIQGNLYSSVAGPARLTISGLQIGRDAGHTVPIDGDAPALFSVLKPISAPAFHLQVLGARLKLGQGEWAGAADLQVRRETMSGASRGSLRGADVNALLGSLSAEGSGKMYGAVDVPSYTVRFGGGNVDGTARLSMTHGRIPVLGVLGSAGAGALSCELSVKQDRLDLSEIVFDSPALKLTGNGTVGSGGTMHFDLSATSGGGERPVVLEGTVDRPQVQRP